MTNKKIKSFFNPLTLDILIAGFPSWRQNPDCDLPRRPRGRFRRWRHIRGNPRLPRSPQGRIRPIPGWLPINCNGYTFLKKKMHKLKKFSCTYIKRNILYLCIAVPMQAFNFDNNILNMPTKLETSAVSPQVSNKVLSFLKDSFRFKIFTILNKVVFCSLLFYLIEEYG